MTVELDREDRPNTAGCLSVGTGDWASGRVDVPGSVLDEIHEMRKTLMLDATPDAPVLLLVEDVAKLLGLPATCFHLTLGSKVLRDFMSLAAEGVGSIRACARLRGRLQPVNGGFGGGCFGGGGD